MQDSVGLILQIMDRIGCLVSLHTVGDDEVHIAVHDEVVFLHLRGNGLPGIVVLAALTEAGHVVLASFIGLGDILILDRDALAGLHFVGLDILGKFTLVIGDLALLAGKNSDCIGVSVRTVRGALGICIRRERGQGQGRDHAQGDDHRRRADEEASALSGGKLFVSIPSHDMPPLSCLRASLLAALRAFLRASLRLSR